MLQLIKPIRLLQGLLIMLIYMNLVSSYSAKQNANVDSTKSFYYRKSYNNIINDLRDHWQSPISYLKKRGYLPEIKNEPDLNYIKLTADDANGFSAELGYKNNDIGNLKIENIQPDLIKRQSSPSANRFEVENFQGNLAKTGDINPLTNSLAVDNYQGKLAKSDDKQPLTNSLAVDNYQGNLEKSDDKQPLTNSLAVDNYQGNLAKSDDKQPLTNSLAVDNYQGNLEKSDDKQPLTNYQGNPTKSDDKQPATNSLGAKNYPGHQPPATNRLVAIENDLANPTKTANKQPLTNNLAVENVLENLIKSNDKQTATNAKDLPLVKLDDPGFFTNMKNKFLGLFTRSDLDNPIKIKNTKLLKELEKDLQKELNKGTLTKNYAQKAVQTVISNEYNYLEKDLIN